MFMVLHFAENRQKTVISCKIVPVAQKEVFYILPQNACVVTSFVKNVLTNRKFYLQLKFYIRQTFKLPVYQISQTMGAKIFFIFDFSEKRQKTVISDEIFPQAHIKGVLHISLARLKTTASSLENLPTYRKFRLQANFYISFSFKKLE